GDLRVGAESLYRAGRRGRRPGTFRKVRPSGRRPGPTLFGGARAVWRRRAHRAGRLPGASDRPATRIAVRHTGRDRDFGGRAPEKEPRGWPRQAARIDLLALRTRQEDQTTSQGKRLANHPCNEQDAWKFRSALLLLIRRDSFSPPWVA